jgi:hypothetical protein
MWAGPQPVSTLQVQDDMVGGTPCPFGSDLLTLIENAVMLNPLEYLYFHSITSR